MPFSLRLDPETEARIRRLTRATGRSKADVVREAVSRYAVEHEAPPEAGETAFDRLRPFIGVAPTGSANLSSRTHEKYRALLRKKHGVRRPR